MAKFGKKQMGAIKNKDKKGGKSPFGGKKAAPFGKKLGGMGAAMKGNPMGPQNGPAVGDADADDAPDQGPAVAPSPMPAPSMGPLQAVTGQKNRY